MDFVEVEGKTYEEAVKKAAAELNVDAKDLDIEVKEVDTKGILGLLGSKKVRVSLGSTVRRKNMVKSSSRILLRFWVSLWT